MACGPDVETDPCPMVTTTGIATLLTQTVAKVWGRTP